MSPAPRLADESGSFAGAVDAGGSGASDPGDDIESVIDEETFRQFEAALGDRAAVRSVLQMYLDDLPKFTAQIRESVDAGRRDEARAAAHRLKGNAGMIGALHLADACRRFESAALDDAENLAELAGTVIGESQHVADAVRARVGDVR